MSGNKYFDDIKGLKWCESEGIGFYPIEHLIYDAAYLEKYREYADTEMGKQLTDSRLAIVDKYTHSGTLLDVGIGSGQFMDLAGCLGFDVNPEAVRMLIHDGTFLNPYSNQVESATFWDSLEHIPDIDKILANISGYIFVSIPIFDNGEHVLKSRHFRPNEHCWYFTRSGFEDFIASHGFKVLEYSNIETQLGREDIGLFVCKRESLTDK